MCHKLIQHGYDLFYSTLLANLGYTDNIDGENYHFSSDIKRKGKAKLSSKSYKQNLIVKCRRNHIQISRTRQQIYDERVDRAKNLGTYKTDVVILGQGDQTTTNT